MSRWSPEQVRGAAPDEASLKSARKLAVPGPWSDTGATDTLVWGKCQGSGRVPYQVSVDLTARAFRCSCPSRKFPCKHTLALLMLWSEGSDIREVSDPQAIDAARAQYSAAASKADTAASGASPKRPPDPQAQAKRRAARLETMDAGIEEFAVWLQDLVRAGTAAARSQEVTWFEAAAARLVDAQCPTLAAEVRELPRVMFSGDSWNQQVAMALGRWWMIVQAWRQREQLTSDRLADVRAALGWGWSTEEVRAGTPVEDRWLILGARRVDLGRVAEQRTWMWGLRTGRLICGLEFAAGSQSLPVPQVTGGVVDGAVALYPGTGARRAVFMADPIPGPGAEFPQGLDIAGALSARAGQLAENPLARVTPVVLDRVSVAADRVVDASGHMLPLVGTPPWTAIASARGRLHTCFGELTELGFTPLTTVMLEEVVPCV